MRLKSLEIIGFKSFAKKAALEFTVPISAIVGPNGSGKSNVAEAMRFVLGEQSLKSMRGKKGEDLIFNGTEKAGRQNVAKVTAVFDNTDKVFNIDFEEVSVTREVFRDGTHQYYINGSQVRLKDILELLSGVHIGASSHHIISQGEADRILNASLKERKAMIEDALGLKIYHWRIGESEKKLIKTEENLKDVEMLRREIAPHLRYLKKQVEKIEKAQTLRVELGEKYAEYLKREELYLKITNERIAHIKHDLQSNIGVLDGEIRALEDKVSNAEVQVDNEKTAQITGYEQELRELRNKKSDISREIGKIEGMIEYDRKRQEEAQRAEEDSGVTIRASMEDVEALLQRLESISSVHEGESYEGLQGVLENIRNSVREFREHHSRNQGEQETQEFVSAAPELISQKEVLQESLRELTRQEEVLSQSIAALRDEIEKDKGEVHEAEKELYEKKGKRSQLAIRLESVRGEESRYSREVNDFEEEVRDGVSLIGEKVKEYHNFQLEENAENEDRTIQENRRRYIERIKIRIEDMGGGSGEDAVKEYKDTQERDEFLEKEIHDLTTSATALRELIADLNVQLDQEFQAGVTKINEQFKHFFSLMFGGGTASLSIVAANVRKKKTDVEGILEDEVPDEDDIPEETGIDIAVSLPRKKIRGLQMLSGGERALTSIALLFAVSQVNPPPFMILDETDAALDEANSRKYGDMLENLSEVSQLIVITHNRETMSRAGVLYGVTMGADATSKLLSVKLEEAEKIAK